MEALNLYARVFVADRRSESEVRADVERALGCAFDPDSAKSDAERTTWFADAFGFEVCFHLQSTGSSHNWYSLALGPGFQMVAPEGKMFNIDFHLAQVLRQAGFESTVDGQEYRARVPEPERES